jgi:hypothetical protein
MLAYDCQDLRDERVIFFLPQHEVDMTWSIWVPTQHLEHAKNRPIHWYRVGHWLYRFEPESSILLGEQDTSTIRSVSVRVLNVVVTMRIAFPDINLDTLERVAFGVLNSTENQQRSAIGIFMDCVTVFYFACVVSVERTKNCSLS